MVGIPENSSEPSIVVAEADPQAAAESAQVKVRTAKYLARFVMMYVFQKVC